MPNQPGRGLDNALGRALFGSFQKSLTSRLDTAGTWEQLRRDAGTWKWQSEGRGALPDVSTLEGLGREVLRSQGLGFQEVNAFRGLANEWRTAKGNLQRQGMDNQIRGGSVFTPKWAKTTGSAVPSRYRARISWQINPLDGGSYSFWNTYEIEGPLTSVSDLLDQAQGILTSTRKKYPIPDGATISAADYELEQI